MNTLILYVSKHGAAKKCAEILSEKLTGKVDLCNIKTDRIPDLSQYDKVIVGSCIYAGRAHKEVNEFCTKNMDVLKGKRLGLYICCMNKKAAEMQLNGAFPEELLKCATVKESLGGEFKFKEMNFVEKLITKMVSKTLSKDDPSIVIDMKKGLSMLSEEKINKFSSLMNNIG